MKRHWLALGFAMLFPAFMAWVYFIDLAKRTDEPNPLLQVIFGAGKTFQFAFPVLYVLAFERTRLRPAAPTMRGLALGLGFGLLVSAGLIALYGLLMQYTNLLSGTPREVILILKELKLDTQQRYLAIAAFISVVHSLLEEYYWRWFVFGWLKRYVPLGVAIVMSSLAFMLHHIVVLAVYLPGNLPLALLFALCVAVGGSFWAWLYHRSGSLYAPWISHLLIDAAIMAVGYDMVRGAWSVEPGA